LQSKISMEANHSEVDLWELIGKGYQLFKKRAGVILLCFFLGLLFSISNFLLHPLEYKSFYKKEFIAQSSAASNDVLYDIINAIPQNIANKNGASKEVSFPEFKNIKAKLDENKNKETRLKLTIEAFEPAHIDSILHALTTYIHSLESLRENFDLQQKQQRQVLAVSEKQISAMDSAMNKTTNANYAEVFQLKLNAEKELSLNKIINFIPLNPDSILISTTRVCVLNVLGWSFLGLVIGFIVAGGMNLVQRK
jgi:hypothetical protein